MVMEGKDLLDAYIEHYMAQDRKKRQGEYYTLGSFIEELEKIENKNAHISIAPYGLNPEGFMSYRGYYEDLALGYNTDSDAQVTVGDVLDWAKSALGEKFYGYKGGEFIMSKSTPLWIANYGKTSNVRISKIDAWNENYVDIYGEIVED